MRSGRRYSETESSCPSCGWIEAQTALAGEETNVVDLHPQAVIRFKENIEQLAEILKDAKQPSLELLSTFKQLVATVVVLPRKARENYTVKIKAIWRAF